MLAFDQIFTQASRWDYMFGGGYSCPVVFRICIGRQWGNGPQHTANYHSIFLQSPGLDVYIPATPEDAYKALIVSQTSKHPAVILEHRWLYKTKEDFLPAENKVFEFPFASIYGTGNDFVILTYADGLIDSLKALEFCNTNGVKGKVICFKFFGSKDRFSMDLMEHLKDLKNIILVDTAPFEFGLLSGVLAHYISKGILKGLDNMKVVCPNFHPCPTSALLDNDYYPDPSKIVKEIVGFGFNLPAFPAYSFDNLHLPLDFDYTTFKALDIKS
jgi:pyruvate dehydrogenase E1 component beta subunit